MRLVMLSELINFLPPPRPVLPRACCSVSASDRRRLRTAATGSYLHRVEAQGSSTPPAASVQTWSPGPDCTTLGEKAAPVLHLLSPGPGETPAEPSRGPQRRMVRAACGFSCLGSLWADGNGESFISPCYRGKGAGRGGVQGSSVHHRTKNRMSTTSKMTKRTIIAHHCRRSGRKRKYQSSCFKREGKLGECFSSLYC